MDRKYANLTGESLKAEMSLRKLKHGNKTKDEMIIRLQKLDSYNKKVENRLLELVGQAAELPESAKPDPMQFYCDHFNAVDRANKYYYQLQWPFKSMSFQPVVVWAMLNCLFISCWTLHSEKCGSVEISLSDAALSYADSVLELEDD